MATTRTLLWSEDEELIRRSARDLVQARMPISHFRALRDAGSAIGMSREVWREMAGLGFAGALIPERWGGAGLGLVACAIVLEECGRTLAPTATLATAVLAATALVEGGADATRDAELPRIASGESVLGFAHDEGLHHARDGVSTRAAAGADGFTLHGEKSFVLDGTAADAFLVSARTDAGRIDLFLVPRTSRGLRITPLALVDHRSAARLALEGVRVAEGAVLSRKDGALLPRLCDRGAALLAAEMLGSTEEVFARTLAWLKERRQFGVPIGSFQALRHRAAAMSCEIELTRSIVLAAVRALEADATDAPALASAAKARATDTFLLVAAEGIQMHGGLGVTDEVDIGLFYKRAWTSRGIFGDAAFHRDRFARLGGY